jgi:hypothetical protein
MDDAKPRVFVGIDNIEIRPGEVLTLWVTDQNGDRAQVEVRSNGPAGARAGIPEVFFTKKSDVSVRSFGEWEPM